MKKLTKIITKISAIAILAFSFTACQDPIFFHIDQEVKLEEPTILGDIFTIIRYGDPETGKLFLANGNIYSKDADNSTHGSWKKMPAPQGHVHSLAADNEGTLYAFVWDFEKETGEGETEINRKEIYYSTDGGLNWKRHNISLKISQTSEYQTVILMCTNTTTKNNRSAYVRIGNGIYNLSKNTAGNDKDSFTPFKTGEYKSCAYLGGVHFFTYFGGACTDPNTNRIYYADGSHLCYTTDGTTKTKNLDSVRSGIITSIAVMKDAVLVCTSNGAALVDKETGNEINFTNLTSTVSSLYESYASLAVYPEKSYKENILYASNQVYGTGSNSAQFTHQGLWSYYPSRGKWNIE